MKMMVMKMMFFLFFVCFLQWEIVHCVKADAGKAVSVLFNTNCTTTYTVPGKVLKDSLPSGLMFYTCWLHLYLPATFAPSAFPLHSSLFLTGQPVQHEGCMYE